MPFEQRKEGKYAVVEVVESRLDASQAEGFRGFVFDMIAGGEKDIVVDLSSVRFMDSSGLGALVSGLKKLAGEGSFALAGAQPAVKDLFDLTSMDRLFKMYGSAQEATGES